MNECLGAIMAKYLAGEASPEETAQLTAWIGEDRSHAREFARLTDIDQVVRPPFDPAGISVDVARERTMLLLQGEERRRRRLRFVVPEACRAMIHVNPAQNPIAENVPQYEKVYALYTKLYQANKGLYKELAKL